MTETANMEALLAEPGLGDPSDLGLLQAMMWLADGLASESMPVIAVAAFAGLAQEARRRGLVESSPPNQPPPE